MRLTLTIDRFEGDRAILVSADGARIEWPKDRLPAGAAEGSVLSLTIEPDENRETETRASAKEILNEILKADDGRV